MVRKNETKINPKKGLFKNLKFNPLGSLLACSHFGKNVTFLLVSEGQFFVDYQSLK